MEKLDPTRPIAIPFMQHPLFRTQYAIDKGVERRLMFKTWGGIGDQICAEPTLRYALRTFKDCEFYLASENPELFKHLPFKRIFNLNDETPNYENYLCFETITPPNDSNLVWLFFSHMLTNCVDFPSLCALRLQLPIADKEIQLVGEVPPNHIELDQIRGGVAIHPGKHWQSKTFPKSFWDAIINGLLDKGIKPIIIGANADDNRGTVDVDASRCYDLRNKFTLPQSIWLLQNVSTLLTNDSAPMHMAASGDAHIGYIATCKHPDMITHWRRGQWQWRERNFGRGGIWDVIDFCPNKKQSVEAEFVPEELLLSWLPEPQEMVEYAFLNHMEYKVNSYHG